MKQQVENLLQSAVQKLQTMGELPAIPAFIQVEPTKDKTHGDFASNIAMILAKPAQKKPRDIAERIIQMLQTSQYVQKVEVAGPGFINFFLSLQALNDVVVRIMKVKEKYGLTNIGRNKRVLVEFVSSNPTGPLHVGHGRHAAYGAVIANLLQAVGFEVYREYYINDAGRQMDILTTSIWLRYLSLCGETITFPTNGYRGDYVIEIAQGLYQQYPSQFHLSLHTVFDHLPPDEPEGGDKEIYIDAMILRAKTLLGAHYEIIFDVGLKNILTDMREDLAEFGVEFDHWFSERAFVKTHAVDDLLEKLVASHHVYEREGAVWFRSTDFGDEKDRVLVRSNGQRTYFTNDAAYHFNKFERGFDLAIDIFGADHHGYIPRMKAAIEAIGIDSERLIYLLVQFVTLYRGGKQIQMSTRGGSFVTLRELRHEVGNDAARFFYVMRKSEQHMDFDLDLAKAQSNENPVYYVQYAYARICSVLKQLTEKGRTYNEANGLTHLGKLTQPQERQLLNTLSRYSDVIVEAALQYSPHQLTHYMRELATDFHAYYNAHPFIVEDIDLCDARLALISATKQTLFNGFTLLGITAPKNM
ncbi:MAG: arginine--tRNA ligase [Gammaproteobacteria bacterium RIFCSPHIGHO2_12_FULL_37_34]|nr:MAG: arginine--tRNA ligase [Gammaproteobacteria bacterium RIFCSPHIGHO2_12_FULL_37_34]